MIMDRRCQARLRGSIAAAILLLGSQVAAAETVLVEPSPTAAPGALVWHIDADGVVHSGFDDGDPCPLTRVTIGRDTILLDRTGRSRQHVAARPYDPVDPVTVEPTPSGRLEFRPASIALVDSVTGETLWGHTYQNAISQRFGGRLDDLSSIIHVPAARFLVLWRCLLDGMPVRGDAVFTIDVASGVIRRVRLIGNLGDGCLPTRDAFVAVLAHDRQSEQQTLSCHEADGNRRWWQTVDAGMVTATGGTTDALLVRRLATLDAEPRGRVTALDAADGSTLLELEVPGIIQYEAALSAGGERLVCAGIRLVDATPSVRLAIAVTGADAVLSRDLDLLDDVLLEDPPAIAGARARVAAVASARRPGPIAVAVVWRSGDTGDHAELWLLDDGLSMLSRTSIPGSTVSYAVRTLEFVADDRLVVAHHPTRPAIFKARP